MHRVAGRRPCALDDRHHEYADAQNKMAARTTMITLRDIDPLFESQRDSGSKPRVDLAKRELPWVGRQIIFSTATRSIRSRLVFAATALRLMNCFGRSPGVARPKYFFNRNAVDELF